MPTASFTFYPKRSRLLTSPDVWYRQLSYYVRIRECGPAERIEGAELGDKLWVIEFRPVLQESPDTSREATVTVTDLKAENLSQQQHPGISAHNRALEFREDGQGRAHLRGFCTKDTDQVKVSFQRECTTPVNCEWAATPADRDVRMAGRRSSADGTQAPRRPGGVQAVGSLVAAEIERPVGPSSWAPPASFV